MNPARWQRLQDLFHTAAELSVAERGSYLDIECGGDGTLRLQVESLILSGEAACSDHDSTHTTLFSAVRQAAALTLSPSPGERVGPWRVVRELGRGGMGSVCLATRADDHYHQQVAIKLLHVGLAGPAMLARFRAERQILANLDHPHIARLLDGGALPSGLPYVAMEYVDGIPIDAYCREHDLGLRARLRLFRQLCEAVAYAHRNLVVHRDIKPGNVLVTRDGTPKLLDFGIAKLLREEGDNPLAALTRGPERLMTPNYASPEQVRGEPVNTATDVYSLGVLLYELLAGKCPFQVSDLPLPEMLRVICETEPPPPGTQGCHANSGANSHPDLDNIVLMAIRKDPARRYASVEQFSDDVGRYLKGFPVLARDDTWSYRTGTFVRRHRWGVAAAALAALMILAFITGMALLARRVAAQRDIAMTERKNAEQVSQFLVDSFRLADRSGQQGRTVTAQEILDRGSQRIFRQLSDQPAVRARMMNTMGEVYGSLGLYDRAQALLEGALAGRRANADRDPEAIQSLTALGELLETRGDYNAAEACYRRALTAEQALSGPESAGTAAALARLGSVLGLANKVAGAEPLIQSSLALRRRLFGNRSAEAADSLSRLGTLERGQERFARAEPLYREALSIRRAVSGPESPETAAAISDLAALLNELGKLKEAETMQLEGLALRRRLYGDAHVLVADDLARLGVLYFNSGDFTDAVSLDRQAAAVYAAALGPESPQLADVLTGLANSLERMGRLPEAEIHMRRALAMNTKLLGEHHPATASNLHNLVNLLHDEGENGPAMKLMRGLVLWQRQTDAASPALAYNLAALGGLKRAAGDWQGADHDYREALDIFRRTYGERHSTYARSLTSFAANRISMGDLQGSEPLLREAIQILRQGDKASPLDLSFPLVALAQNLLLQSKPGEAEKLAREAVQLRRRLMPPADARLALSVSVLGGSLAALSRDREAEPLLIESHRNLLQLRHDKQMAPELRRLSDLRRKLNAEDTRR